MKKLLLISTALAAMTASAVAADLPRRGAPAPYLAAAPLFTWTGFYVGLNAGAAFGNSSSMTDLNGYNLLNEVTGLGSKTSFTGGAQAGFNYQINSFVVGVEGDINYLDHKQTALVASAPLDSFVRARGSYLATVRARAGVAFDRALIYVTGGFAFSDLKTSYIDNCDVGLCGFDLISASAKTNTGYALGAGLEYAFTNNWTAKAEYLYTHFDGKTATAVSGLGGTFSFRAKDTTLNVVRVGVNYKF
ncbi:MAG: porin family protein [Beijerinckiaceae bacterium]|jgi:outer membrane immunogenic protein|nr:porin family protein [Beijerinckiaceae bacterium]